MTLFYLFYRKENEDDLIKEDSNKIRGNSEIMLNDWQSLIVNPVFFDLEKINKIKREDLINQKEEEFLQLNTEEEIGNFLDNVNKYVIGEDNRYSKVLLHILCQALINRQKVILGDMTEILLRQIVCNYISLSEVI